ncbi:MAG: DUF3500 domain-containing protein [Planctomycetes bacterium]|nr:DUF3500 domain-containing protein [Planctomycetota bacterium]
MNEERTIRCPECGDEVDGLTRREFVKGVGTAAIVASAGAWPVFAAPRATAAAVNRGDSPETAVKRLYGSLSEKQREAICFPWEHELRQKYGANWAITKPSIAEFFTKEQQETIREIFRGVTSEEGYDRFVKQMDQDYGGFGRYHVAIFGEPGEGKKFEWVMTGRHMTIRCDGNFDDGTAFGGPMVYGHGTGDSQKGLPGNVFYYQTLRANEVFGMLDGKQREKALLPRAPAEDSVQIRAPGAQFPGIPVSELSSDQKELVHKVMHDLLAPYRKEDVKEAVGCLTAGGGLDKIHLAFYQQGDIGDDEIWDIWRLEGPTFVWHFRGSPHVHTYVNIASKTG